MTESLGSDQRFGEFEWQSAPGRLTRDGKAVLAGGRAAAVLRVLIDRRDRPVSKDELLDAVWPQQDIEEGNLAVQISTLRRLLGPQAIATVPGQGYRFMIESPAALPPPETAPASLRRHNLPLRAAPMIGRDAELADLQAELERAPLLSLVGTSGIGKTRLALALATTQLDRHADGIWWVDLADLADRCDAATVAVRVGHVTGIAAQRASDPVQALAQGLRHRRMLLVMDNCEHVLDASAALVQAMLQGAPGLRILVTSQEALRVGLEQVFRLGTLPVPEDGAGLAEARRCGAFALLLDRIRAADRRFRWDPALLPAAIGICRQLDGNALALTMAAARVPWMGLQVVHDRLADRLQLLSQDSRLVPPRHRSLQAAMQWSYALLKPAEQAALRHLVPFRGGFALDSGCAVVAAAAGIDAFQAVELIGTLVDKSLVQVHADLPMRYRLLESTRLFAERELAAEALTAALARRHRQAMVARAQAAMADLWRWGDAPWMRHYAPDSENFGAAMDHAVADRDAGDASLLFELLYWLARLRAGGMELRRWAEAASQLAESAESTAPAVAARLQQTLGGLWRNQSPPSSLAHYERALALLGPNGDAGERFKACCGLATCCARVGQPGRSADLLAQAQRLLRPEWPARLRMLEADAAGFQAHGAGDLVGARQHFGRFRSLSLACGADGGLAVVTHNLADLALTLGEVDDAVRLGREHIAWLRSQTNAYNLGFALGNLTSALVRAGALDEALAAAREGLPLLRVEDQAAWLFDHLALLAALRARPRDAARLLGYGDACRAAVNAVREPNETAARDVVAQRLRASLAPQELAALSAEGAAMPAALADALALEQSSAVMPAEWPPTP